MNKPALHFDYIIVGGGTAGCVLAERLTASGKYRVALFEAGGEGKSPFSDMPGGVIRFMHSKAFNWLYRSSDKAPLRNGKGLYTPRGKGLGGSSLINAMIYTRGVASDYEHWAAVSSPDWAWDKILQRFRKLECNQRGEDTFHGAHGPLKVSDVPVYFSAAKQFVEAGVAAGIPFNPDFNGEQLFGVGPYQFTIFENARFSARKAFLEPARTRSNLTIFTHSLVGRITVEGTADSKRANGIQFKQRGKTYVASAHREVIIAGGAINSPQLLLLSGIGPKTELEQHGIPIIVDSPEVGKNLQDHVDVMIHYRNKRKDGISITPRGLLKMAAAWWQYQRHKTGPLAVSPAEVGGFIKSQPQLDVPDLQLHFVSTRFNDSGWDLWPAFTHGYACHVCVLRPKARGELRLASSDPTQAPTFSYNFLDNEEDKNALLSGVKQVRHVMNQAPLAAHNGGEVWPGEVTSDDELLKRITANIGLIYHPTSTCRMGNDNHAVVDPKLRVNGVRSLRVIDASIMPTVVSGNTNAPTMVIADIGADFILADAESDNH
ncbi:Choline dehydrogenase [Pseudidiomarina maritima]|uniref:Choline dehydrogenase n=1 Tax=Pseudidiomarina maritima TaxID=519453 RepID=A0A1I6GBC3_9GAMM|nr:GMC family oxidoreductase N-terminal domain-containing protein [Pseudidiomarina maritima]SFR39441.1 Choline dehydrogenase [Pseudidiomarina maritima]